MRYLVFIALCMVSMPGCVSVSPRTAGQPGTPQLPPGRYHKVERGQTLWRISRIYGIDLQELLDANGVTDSTKVSAGQMLLIPGSAPVVPVSSVPGKRLPEDEEFVWPASGKLLARSGEPYSDGASRGIAIAPSGRDAVVASRSGRVVFYSDNFLDLGKTLIIEHAGGFWTVYGRNSEVFVKVGDIVPRGGTIARIGRAGRDMAVYLYFEIRKGHVSQNPGFYLPNR